MLTQLHAAQGSLLLRLQYIHVASVIVLNQEQAISGDYEL